MTRDSGGEQPQKTVAELLAQHGASVDGGRRRHRRAAEDDEPNATDPPSRERGIGDTAPQAIIDRVTGDGGTPPPANRPAGARRLPGGQPQDSGHFRRPDAPPQPPNAQPPQPQEPPRPRAQPNDSGPLRRPRPQDSGAMPRPPQDSGAMPRPPQDSGAMPRPPQDSGALQRPQDSAAMRRPPAGPPPPVHDSGHFRRPEPPQESGAFPMPEPQDDPGRPGPPRPRGPRQPPPASPDAEDTRAGIAPARPPRAVPPPQAAPPPPPPPPGGLAARLDGLNAAEPEAPEAGPPPMGSGHFPAPPRRPRRPRPPRKPPQEEPHTEQFAAVGDDQDAPELDEPPAGLAGWRQRRRQAQSEDTQVGVMPAVGGDDLDDLDDEPPQARSGYAVPPGNQPYPPAGPGYPGEIDDDDLPPTGYHENLAADLRDELSDEDLVKDEYGEYSEYSDYEDEPLDDFDRDPASDVDAAADEVHPDELDEPSPGKQWAAMAAQLAAGVVGGAAVWLGFNWLWGRIPAAALIGALVVIVGLVWIVRKIRRADDLQTTVLAVLVGLVVTVSPAALLLLSR
ncbi:hypothetical protein [Amycolatopsis nigrescens]|uniref:hypothetical protein n=1 Tax=Amycolatopsis nigrescens TaxID=381445 RepID=UPI000475C9D9|nr:hypothetical protein [Amycolatopsis nigrescens]